MVLEIPNFKNPTIDRNLPWWYILDELEWPICQEGQTTKYLGLVIYVDIIIYICVCVRVCIQYINTKRGPQL